ncbi:MAG TPA: hypothetical protein VGF94_05660 [Kofleriaceae bacterium]
MRGLLIFVAVAAVAACTPAGGPTGTLDAYGNALASHDYGHAYDLMSSAFRNKVSRDDYIRMMRDNGREVDETAERLRGKHGSLEVSAELEYGLGDEMRLVEEGGDWKIASNPLAFYDQSTPRAALRSFIRAYRLERWDIMLRFVPDEWREKMDPAKMKQQFTGPSKDQIETLMSALANHVDETIDERGETARMAYGDKYEVKFVKQDGVWKLKDLD